MRITLNLIYKYRRYFIILPFFLILSLFVFFPTIFGSPLWDDWSFIFRNSFMHQNTSILAYFNGTEERAWPVFHTFLWFLLKLFKDNYSYYHLVSIFLHGLNGYLCWVLLKKLEFKNCLLLAIIFMVHPLHLFTVGWIIQIKTLLSIMFFFTSLITFFEYYKNNKILYLLLSITFFGISVFSKSTTAIFSLCLILSYPLIRKEKSIRQFISIVSPFVILSFCAVTYTVWELHNRQLILAIISLFLIIFLWFKFGPFLKRNYFLILPLIFSCSLIRLSYLSNFNILIGSISILFFFLVFIYQEKIKRFKKSFLIFCFIFSFYILSVEEMLLPYIVKTPVDNIVMTLKNFIRYCMFIVYPSENFLFSQNTLLSFSALEFSLIFCFFTLFYLGFRKLSTNNFNLTQVGLIFFSATILPFCGIFLLPIFGFTNFVPYWLSIPYIGILPLISHLLKSKTQLSIVALILLSVTHIQSYKFINNEEVFLESIEKSPDLKILQISLLEHYIFTYECKKARNLFKDLHGDPFLIRFSIEKKVNNCKGDR